MLAFHATRAALATAFVCAVACSAVPSRAFDLDGTPGRLPKDVVPTAYRIAITPSVTAKTFHGNESVTLRVRRPVARIVFNTLNIAIAEARFDGAHMQVKTDNNQQVSTLALPRTATIGMHTVSFVYDGKIEDAAQGLFAQDYRAGDGTTRRMLSTQFESTDARRMFPSWDEPAFRSTYQLTVTLPARWSAISNTPIAARAVHGTLATIRFAPTPPMPSYLVVLSAGELASIGGVGSDGVQQRVWAVNGAEKDGSDALHGALQILPYYDAYFGARFPLPKLDHVAIPGGFNGAMENWGGITYNDSIIIQPRGTQLRARREGYSIVAHEMAHQWNGDLVTMAWWDDIWLNESFASWMAAKATDHFNPAWKWWQGEDASKEMAMNADARLAAHAIQQHVTDELQADAAFDPEITYDKGEAFLRMLEAYLGDGTFRAGVRSYIRAHAYSNAKTADLWAALGAASHKDVAALARAWTEQPGFPVVGVRAACDASGNRTVTLSQRRFLLDPASGSTSRWNIPIALASGTRAASYMLMTASEQSGIPAGRCTEPLRANAGGIGYYRVAYDPATLDANRRAFASLDDDDKIAMLDDEWALAGAGHAGIASYLGLVRAMGDGRDVRAWEQIVEALTALETNARGTPAHDAVAAFARSVVSPVTLSIGWDPRPGEPSATAELRSTVLGALGLWGDPATVAEAHRRLEGVLANPASVPPDIAQLTIDIAATNADAATFDRLHALVQRTKDPVLAAQYRDALMHVRDPALAARALQVAISPEIPPQEDGKRNRLVYAVADWNPKLAWSFFQAHLGQLMKVATRSERVLNLARDVPRRFYRAEDVDALQAWLTNTLPPSGAPYIARAVRRARTDQTIRDRLAQDTSAYLAEQARARPSGGRLRGNGVEQVFVPAMSRQLAMFASAAQPTVLVGDRGDVTYIPEFLDRELADALVRELNRDTIWRADSRLMYGKRVLVPRETAGRGERMPQPWTPALLTIRSMIERHTGTTFDYVFLNRYRDGRDAVAWHGDRDGTKDARLVVGSLSLGASRAFQLRPKKESGLRHDPVTVEVAHGDLVVMAGDTQLYWEHRVPRDPRVTGERLNVTFRQHRARNGADPNDLG